VTQVPTISETGIVRFGVFEVDRKTGELRRNGAKVKLQEQPLQVLFTLLERPGALITREELRSRLWAHDTFVDFDHSLNAAVRRLRDALGDSAENPRFVETMARRGYRFLAPVNGEPRALPAETTRHAPYVWWILGTTALVMLVVGIAVGRRMSRKETPFKTAMTERRLTANAPENLVQAGAISPDGKYLAFADAGGFYLRQIDTGETQRVRLPKGFDAKPAAWFPDGAHVVMVGVAGPNESASMWEISVMGGAPVTLSAQGRYPAVSPDGSQIAYLAGATEDSEIWVMQSDGAGSQRLVGDGKSMLGPPVWSPDGKRIAYARGCYSGGMSWMQGQLEVLDLTNRKTQVLFASAALGGTIAWTPDQRLIYSLSEPIPNQNDSNLWALPLSPTGQLQGPSVRLTREPGIACFPFVTTDGKRLSYFRRTMEPDVYVADLEGGTRLSALRRLTLDERSDYPYSWTPDNKTVIFASDRNGPFNIFKQRLDDTEPELLVRTAQDAMIPRLSPDASDILYLIAPGIGNTSTKTRLMRVPLAGGPPQEVVEAAGINNQQCGRSPSTVCLLSTVEPGKERFFRFDPLQGKTQEISQVEVQSADPHDFNWSLSPDGTKLALAKKTGSQPVPVIQIVSLVDGSKQNLPVPGWSGIGTLDWTADGKGVWAMAFTTTGSQALLNVSLQGKVKPVLEETKMSLGWAIPSADGKHIAFWKGNGNSNVWMLENF